MKEYIRTKDGKIFNLLELVIWKNAQGLDENEISFWDSAYRFPEMHKLGLEARILKQADNIEELCDCKVIVDSRFSPIPMLFTMPLSDIIDTVGPNGYDAIYGAIFTDKGIIYVAEVNEKGELVLL